MNFVFFALSAYILFSIIHCAAISANQQKVSAYTKPLLMPQLLAYYLLASRGPELIVTAALAAGFLGDVFLMFQGGFLIFGILAFCAGHLFYIAAFLHRLGSVEMQPWLILPALIFVTYGALVYSRLKQHIRITKAALIPYIAVLLTMGFSAFAYFINSVSIGSIAVFLGAIFFILSDSLLSFDLFIKQKKWRTVAVMATYTLAQGLLTTGLIH